MPELSAAATLELWEAVHALPPVERALALAGGEGGDAQELARLPVGRRDARLLAVHAAIAGPEVEATAPCPQCRVDAEFAIDVAALVASADDAIAPAPLEVDDRVISWRPPDSRDVAAAAAATDAADAERVLLERCVGVAELTDDARRAVSAAMAEADPLAEVLVDLVCPACGETFVAELDVAGFVWAEVRSRALALMRDVDALARAYGWTEEQVLALGDRRREAYLELAAEGGA